MLTNNMGDTSLLSEQVPLRFFPLPQKPIPSRWKYPSDRWPICAKVWSDGFKGSDAASPKKPFDRASAQAGYRSDGDGASKVALIENCPKQNAQNE